MRPSQTDNTLTTSADGPDTDVLFCALLRLGDNCLILAQQIGKWCGHAPDLEEDIALANVGLDLIGQTQMWLNYAGEVEGKGRSADDLAFFRDTREFRNALLVEQRDEDYGGTIMRQFLFDLWHFNLLQHLCQSSDSGIQEIAAKAVKEVAYHADRSTDLVIRLGDGSDESHRKMQDALDSIWFCVEELHSPDRMDEAATDLGMLPDLVKIGVDFRGQLSNILAKANLTEPSDVAMRHGGKSGLHGEGLGYLLAEMQSLQRIHPGAQW